MTIASISRFPIAFPSPIDANDAFINLLYSGPRSTLDGCIRDLAEFTAGG